MYILTIAILPGTTTALGDTMLVVRESTGEVTIPVFDTGLGTLTAASLNVTLLAWTSPQKVGAG